MQDHNTPDEVIEYIKEAVSSICKAQNRAEIVSFVKDGSNLSFEIRVE